MTATPQPVEIAVARVEERLVSMDARWDQRLDSMSEALKDWRRDSEQRDAAKDARITDLELRVRALEALKWKLLGALVVIAVLVSFVSSVLSKHL